MTDPGTEKLPAQIRQREHDRLGDLVAELEEIHGPVSDEELAAARAEWPRQVSRRPRRP